MSLVSYAQTYNMVKSSNSTFMIHHLIQSGLVHLYTLSPQFSSNGWSEILPSLYLSPSPIALQAFSSLSEDVNPLLTTQQSILMMPTTILPSFILLESVEVRISDPDPVAIRISSLFC